METVVTNPIGLSNEEALRRLKVLGPNVLATTPPRSWGRLFLDQFLHPFIYVLIIACTIVAFLGDYLDAYVIAGVIVLNAVIGVIQEGKAQNTLRALAQFVTSNATVIRGGKEIVIPDTDVVVGDVILVREGNTIPADATVFFERGFLVDQSALTGESEPISKTIDGTEEGRIFRGTQCVGGFARAVVTATGDQTNIGAIAQGLSTIDTDVPLKRAIKSISKTILYITIVLLLFVVVVGWRQYELSELLPMIVAVGVSVIPESLPVVVTLILAGGVRRMSKKNALVKKLQAVEALGQTDIIAVDKTGTITRNEMMVVKIRAGEETFEVSGEGYSPTGSFMVAGKNTLPAVHPGLVKMLTYTALIADAQLVYESSTDSWKRAGGDPTDAAMVVVANKAGFPRQEFENDYQLIEEVPFSTDTKTHSIRYRHQGKLIEIVAGSPEIVLDSCTSIETSVGIDRFTEEKRENEKLKIAEMMNTGLRVIAISYTFGEQKVLAGYYGIQDSIRQGVAESIADVHHAGVRVIMITGDHQHTAKAIAKEVGIWVEGQDILSGYDIDTYSDDEIIIKLEFVNVFARVNPEQKLRIIELLKKAGHTVAMTGDGVNDALSLVRADLGISMGRIGTQVAQEASDIILLDDKFASIVSAVGEGRRMHVLISRTVAYLLSTNFGELFMIAGTICLGLPLPFTPTQIIWINLITDSFLVAALAVDRNKNGIMLMKPKDFSGPIINKASLIRMAFMAITMAGVSLALYAVLLPVDHGVAATVAFMTIISFQWFNVFNVRGYSLPKPSLFVSLFAVIILQFVAFRWEMLREALSITLLGPQMFAFVFAGALIILTDALWRWYNRGVRTF